MGGNHSVQQIQESISTSVTNMVSETLIERSVSVNQQVTKSQIIEDIEIYERTRDCPSYAPPGEINVKNVSNVDMTAMVSMQNVNVQELSRTVALGSCAATQQPTTVAQKIESMVNDEIDKKKDGSLAFTDNTSVTQSFKLNGRVLVPFF